MVENTLNLVFAYCWSFAKNECHNANSSATGEISSGDASGDFKQPIVLIARLATRFLIELSAVQQRILLYNQRYSSTFKQSTSDERCES